MAPNGLRLARAALLASLLLVTASRSALADSASRVRWDILAENPSSAVPGGSESATAADGSMITLSTQSSGNTFIMSASGNVVHPVGEGTWSVFPPSSTTPSATGTYQVTGIDFFAVAPGTLVGAGITDSIGDINETAAGLAVFRIAYSDGSTGDLVFSCALIGTPPDVFEGITATKGAVDYLNSVPPPGDAGTLFHISPVGRGR